MAYLGNTTTSTRKNTAVGVKSVVYAAATHTGQIFTAANCGLPPYNAGNVQVAVNGVLLPSTTFTAIDGVSITLSGLTLSESDEINFLMFNEGAPEQVSTASAYISSGTIDNTLQTNTRLIDPILTDAALSTPIITDATSTDATLIDPIIKNSVSALKTTTYSVLTTDSYILCGHATTPFTITLFTAVGNSGRVITIKNINVATVTVDSAGGTIDGAATYSLTIQYETISFFSDGTNWYIS